jgi:hypothetical protein
VIRRTTGVLSGGVVPQSEQPVTVLLPQPVSQPAANATTGRSTAKRTRANLENGMGRLRRRVIHCKKGPIVRAAQDAFAGYDAARSS